MKRLPNEVVDFKFCKRLHNASEDSLFEQAWQRLEEVMSYGTGAVEIKVATDLAPKMS